MGRELDVLMYGDQTRTSGLTDALGKLALRVRQIRSDTPLPRSHTDWASGIVFAETAEELAAGREAITRFAPNPLPIIVVGPSTLANLTDKDAWIPDPALPEQLSARVRSLFRLHTMEFIAKRRASVTALYGRDLAGPDRADQALSVLYVGEASPRFMSLIHIMEDAGAEVIAAFSSYSAFDYLHERPFDAVVLNAQGKQDTAFTISSAMRRNARLYHTPVLLLSDHEPFDAADEAFARGVSDIIAPSTNDTDMRDRILTLAAERRRRRDAKAALEACRDPRTLDVETGLFHDGFITSHVQDLLNGVARDEVRFSLMALDSLLPEEGAIPDDTASEKARRQFAAMLRHLLRSEDAACRLDDSRFLAVLPYTDAPGVDCVAARIAAIAECTAFDSGDPLQPFRLTIRSTQVMPQPGETAEALIERAVRGLQTRETFIARVSN